MFGTTKRFRPNPVFDVSLYPAPPTLKRALDLVSLNFNNTRMRNLDIFYDKETPLYGMMTNYEGSNFCWIQPTKVKSGVVDEEYDQYIQKINKENDKFSARKIEVGMDCIANYDVDKHWYRGIVIREEPEYKWLVLFIDYGNFQVCTEQQISDIVLEAKCNHYYAPVQAVCCRLYNIIPKHTEYREDVDIYLERFYAAHSNSFLEIKVKNVRQDYVVDCDIFLPKKDACGPNRLYHRHIGHQLVDAGLASYADAEAAHAIKVVEPKIEKKEEENEEDDEEDLARDEKRPSTSQSSFRPINFKREDEKPKSEDIKPKVEEIVIHG